MTSRFLGCYSKNQPLVALGIISIRVVLQLCWHFNEALADLGGIEGYLLVLSSGHPTSAVRPRKPRFEKAAAKGDPGHLGGSKQARGYPEATAVSSWSRLGDLGYPQHPAPTLGPEVRDCSSHHRREPQLGAGESLKHGSAMICAK